MTTPSTSHEAHKAFTPDQVQLLSDAAPLLAEGMRYGPLASNSAKTAFKAALGQGEVRAHLGLAWLALWEDAPETAVTHLRAFFTDDRSPSVRADELFVLALRAVCRSGLDLPQDLRKLVFKYVLGVSLGMEFLIAQGAPGREVRDWLKGGAPDGSKPEIPFGRNIVLLLTAALSVSGAVWLLLFDGPPWILAVMPAVFLVTGYNRIMNHRGLTTRRAVVAEWGRRQATDPKTW